jgi:CheY-like chemotaxis protein
MLSVLVVDDEAVVRHALRRVLEHDGMTGLEAESGGAALRLLAGEKVDAVGERRAHARDERDRILSRRAGCPS